MAAALRRGVPDPNVPAGTLDDGGGALDDGGGALDDGGGALPGGDGALPGDVFGANFTDYGTFMNVPDAMHAFLKNRVEKHCAIVRGHPNSWINAPDGDDATDEDLIWSTSSKVYSCKNLDKQVAAFELTFCDTQDARTARGAGIPVLPLDALSVDPVPAGITGVDQRIVDMWAVRREWSAIQAIFTKRMWSIFKEKQAGQSWQNLFAGFLAPPAAPPAAPPPAVDVPAAPVGAGAVDDDPPDAPTEYPRKPTVKCYKIGKGGRDNLQVKLQHSDTTKHIYMVGEIGSGKTTLLQHLLEQDAMYNQHRENIIIIDTKGDLSQLILDSEDEKFNKIWRANVYTFGSTVGIPATLDPMVLAEDIKQLAVDLADSPQERDLAITTKCDFIWEDLSLNLCSVDREFKMRLEGGATIGDAQHRQYGRPLADKKMWGDWLKQVNLRIFEKAIEAGEQPGVPSEERGKYVPTSRAAWLREFRQVKTQRVGPPSGHATVAPDTTLNMIQDSEINALATEIEMNLGNPTNKIMSPNYPNAPKPQYLDGRVLLQKPPLNEHGLPQYTNVHIINMKALGDGPTDRITRGIIVSKVLRNTMDSIFKTGGNEFKPTTLLCVDECNLIFPTAVRANGITPEAQSTRAVAELMQQGRGFGVGVVLATQQPKNVNKELLKNVAGAVFIGRMQADNDQIDALRGLFTDTPTRDRVKTKLSSLGPHEFISAIGRSTLGGAGKVKAPKKLKRTREDAGPWCVQANNPLKALYEDVDDGEGRLVRRKVAV